MTIGHISDTHNKHKQIKWGDTNLSKIDVLIHSGDISGRGRQSEVENFFKWWKVLPCQYKILVSGNHDLCFDPDLNSGCDPEWLRDLLLSYTEVYGHYYLENSGVEINGVNFWGSPISPTFGKGWAFNRNRGEEIRKTWDLIPTNTDVLITHGPAWGFVDWGDQAKGPLGCEELREKIKRIKPLIHLCGHIHEDYGYAYDQDTNYFNGSICNLYGYEPVNAPWIIDANFKEREIKIISNESKSKESEELGSEESRADS